MNSTKKAFILFYKSRKSVKACIFSVLSIISILFSFLFAGATFALRVDYDGKTIATIKARSDFDNAVTLVSRAVNGSDVEQVVKQPVYYTALVLSGDIDNSETVAKAIIENTDNIVYAQALTVNGETVACVKEDYNINNLLEKQRTRFELEDAKCSSEFVDTISVKEGYYLADELTEPEISNALIESLKVRTVMEITHDTSIPFATKTQNNANKLRGYSKVLVNGEEGTDRITETVTFINGEETDRIQSEVVVCEPTTKVVEVGTARSVVSASDRQVAKDSGFQFPLPRKGWTVSAYFGDGRNHQAVDLACHKGTPIYAAKGGKVVSAGWDGNYGQAIVIDHGNGVKTRYAHESEIFVKVGDVVKVGEEIGAVGRTGNASGNHLHFEVIINGKRVDPAPYINLV